MRKFTIDEINENIDKNRKNINYQLAKKRSNKIYLKSKKRRDKDEIKALTEITKATLERAKREGKFVILDERKIYYDPAE